ncbi:uncharacterized protein BKA55DRAFT_720721 [Fusarium redolens]|uniref:Uncharacterized protein n=1 Tax=Fusarium redolens TaxID=48865 RepID=A0A9P9FWB7_FUSRE|nr:uncharacterized protein BKA55DRAFT_720721 [Fusarium redolens]KAH7207815.1 hypothetical protein BKA55DRAFT_720721 [Fusarium redolens]
MSTTGIGPNANSDASNLLSRAGIFLLVPLNVSKMKFTHLYLLGHLFVSTNAAGLGHQKDDLPLHRDGTNCQQSCEILASELPGRLHYDDSDSNFTIWDQKQLETIYVYYVKPASANEVSNILQVLIDKLA